MTASTSAHALTTHQPDDAPISYSLSPLWRDIRDDLRARRRDHRGRTPSASPDHRHLHLVASDGKLVDRY